MIYGDIILEQQYEKLSNPINILQEYYENEITMLNSVIKYQNESSVVTESYELKALNEGFIENVKQKIKEIIRKLKEWFKKFLQIIKNKRKELRLKYDKQYREQEQRREEMLKASQKDVEKTMEKLREKMKASNEEKAKAMKAEFEQRMKDIRDKAAYKESNRKIEITYYDISSYWSCLYTVYSQMSRHPNPDDEVEGSFDSTINFIKHYMEENTNAKEYLDEHKTTKSVTINEAKKIINTLEKIRNGINTDSYINKINNFLKSFEQKLSTVEPDDDEHTKEFFQEANTFINLINTASKSAAVYDEQIVTLIDANIASIRSKMLEY